MIIVVQLTINTATLRILLLRYIKALMPKSFKCIIKKPIYVRAYKVKEPKALHQTFVSSAMVQFL